MTTYQKLQDIVRTANLPNVTLNGSVDIDVEFLNSVFVMVEELRDSLERIQKLKPGKFAAIQSGIASFLTIDAIDHAYIVSNRYWPKEK